MKKIYVCNNCGGINTKYKKECPCGSPIAYCNDCEIEMHCIRDINTKEKYKQYVLDRIKE